MLCVRRADCLWRLDRINGGTIKNGIVKPQVINFQVRVTRGFKAQTSNFQTFVITQRKFQKFLKFLISLLINLFYLPSLNFSKTAITFFC